MLNLVSCRKLSLKALRSPQSCWPVCQKETTRTRTSPSWCGAISRIGIFRLCTTMWLFYHCRRGWGVAAAGWWREICMCKSYLMINFEGFLSVKFVLSSLQAFVFFHSWDACCEFVRDYITNPVNVGEWTLRIHFVLQDMHPGSSEVWKQSSLGLNYGDTPVSLKAFWSSILKPQNSSAMTHHTIPCIHWIWKYPEFHLKSSQIILNVVWPSVMHLMYIHLLIFAQENMYRSMMKWSSTVSL